MMHAFNTVREKCPLNRSKKWLIVISLFLTLVCNVLFEHKQYLQSYEAEISMQTEISSFKILAV